MDWEQGRQLSSITINGGTVNYEYNEDGLRTVRQLANGARREYFYNGTQLEYIKIVNANGNLTSTMRYIYNSSGQAEYIMYVDKTYAKNPNVFSLYYILRDSEGKIHKLIKVREPNESKTGVVAVLAEAVTYTYGPYGELLNIAKATGESVGTYNPLVYKDYIWDSETDWYYVQSRYYDPVVGRFVNADIFTSTGQGVLGTNMFSYCNNDPINHFDPTGMWTFGLSIGINATAALGVGVGIGFAIDGNGNFEWQWNHIVPGVHDTKYVGVLDAGAGLTMQFTNAETVQDLHGKSSFAGASGGGAYWYVGADVISFSDSSDLNGNIDGFQLTGGVGVGVDVHIGESYTAKVGKSTKTTVDSSYYKSYTLKEKRLGGL